MPKIWIKKSRKNLILEYPEYYKLIIESNIDDYLLYILILIKDMTDLSDLEMYKNELLVLRLEITIKIINILYTRGINIILNEIKKNNYQYLLSVILNKIKNLNKELENFDKKIEVEAEVLIIHLKKILNNLNNLIKNKLLNFNIIEEIKDLILEYY